MTSHCIIPESLPASSISYVFFIVFVRKPRDNCDRESRQGERDIAAGNPVMQSDTNEKIMYIYVFFSSCALIFLIFNTTDHIEQEKGVFFNIVCTAAEYKLR